MDTDSAPAQPNRFHWLLWGFWALAFAGLAYLAGLTLWLGLRGLFFPYQLDYGEGVMLHFVKEWSLGRPIYKIAEGYPYITSNYAPLAIVLALALTPILGLSYTAGRLWALVAIGALAAIILAWIRRESGHWLPAAAAALIFVGSPYIYHWAPLFRVDLLGLALTLAGLAVVYFNAPVQSPPSPAPTGGTQNLPTAKRWGLRGGLLAALLFIAALYTKQSFIFAPAAALAYLFFFGDRRQGIRMALTMLLLGGGLFLLINTLTGGGFWYGLFSSNVNPFLWPEFWQQQADFFGAFAPLALLAAWYFVDKFLLERHTPLRARVSPLDLYLPAALASLLLAGKAGAWENYFFEALAVLCLCAGLGLARLMRRHVRGNGSSRRTTLALPLLAPLLVLAQVALMWHTPRDAGRYLRLTLESNESIQPILAGVPDPIISEDMGLLVTNGKTLDYYSFQNSQLARAGRWDQSWELGQLRDRRLSMVILERGTRLDVDRYQRFTREFLSELDRNYSRSRTVGKYEIYEPDPLQHEAQVDFGGELALRGWSLHAPRDLGAGDTFDLTAVWQAQQPLNRDYTAFAHLVDREGQRRAGDDHQPYEGLYPTTAWGSGEMVRDTFTLTVPPDAPPGLYDVYLGWYDAATQERLPVGGNTAFRVAALPIDWQATADEPLQPIAARFGPAITLEGYNWQAAPGELRLTLRWSAGAFLDTDYTVFVHLVDPQQDDQVLAQDDAPPLGGRWPTSLWLPGQPLDDRHTLLLPADLPPGRYHLLIGLYDPAISQRLPLQDGRDALRLPAIDLQ